MKKWKDISIEEQEAWLSSWEPNGCWAKTTIFGYTIRPPLAVFFEASCNIHDWGYHFWQNEQDRKQVDEWLLKWMLIDCQKITDNECKRIKYVMMSYLYYGVLRILWRRAFYKNKLK